MSEEEARLRLVHDGKSNILVIRRGSVDGVHEVVVDFCKDLPNNRDKFDVENSVVNRIAQSTDFICSHANCCYHHRSESRYILHARSHFPFEIVPDAVYDTEFKCVKGKYICSKCPRLTTDWISFREHIRHHIFQKPYMCSLCLIEISSVPNLRLHFQKCHVGKTADFEFNGSVYELNSLLSLLLPEAPAVTEPLRISFKLPVHMTTRICCTSALGVSHPVVLMQHLLSSGCLPASRCPEASVFDKSAGVRKVPGKYMYSHGVYKCITCRFAMRTEVGFTRHVWKHVHGSWKGKCYHNTKGTLSAECAVVKGLIAMVKKVELTRAIDSLKMSETETSEASASTANGKNMTSQTGAVHSLQPNVAAETDLPSRNKLSSEVEETYVDVDVLSQMAADETVVLRHSQSPLKVHCDQCSFTCDTEVQLELHKVHGHKSEPSKHFKCPECNTSSPKRVVISWHLSHHIGNHSIEYYACSACSVERQYPGDIWNHIQKKHRFEHVPATSMKRVENVCYLQNIMKCPVCKDGLVWKDVYIRHIRVKHELLDLAVYLNSNYSNSCPNSISFPRHLLKAYASVFVSEAWESLETSGDNSLLHESCKLPTNDLDVQCDQQHKQGPSRTELSPVRKEENKHVGNSETCNRTKRNQTAKVKAYRELHASDLEAKQQSQSSRSLSRTELSSLQRKNNGIVTAVPSSDRTKPSRSTKVKANSLLRVSHELHISDSDGQREHDYDHSQSSKKSSFVQEVNNSVAAEVALPSSVLCQPSRTAKIKANALIITPPLLKQHRQSSKRKFSMHQKSNGLKQLSSKPYQHLKRSVSAADRPDVSKKVVAEPQTANDSDLLTEFISMLPGSQVFVKEIKCPSCYFASKVRVNLLRHVKSHSTTNDKGSAGIQSNEQLSYNLWKESSGHSVRDCRTVVEGQAVKEPAAPVISNVRTENASDAFFISPNSRDTESHERRATLERDVFTQSELIDSSSIDAMFDSVDDDDADVDVADDEISVPSDRQSCESCSEQFDSYVELERHISESYGGPYSCHVCGILMCQKSSMQEHYSTMHPISPVLFSALHRKLVSDRQEVVGTGKSKRKVARVQGFTKETLKTEPQNVLSDTSLLFSDACTAGGPGSSLPISSASQTAVPAASAVAVSSTLTSDVPPATVIDNVSYSSVPSSNMSPFIAQLLSYASASSSVPSALPMNSLMAAVSMNTIATIAAQLVPLLATMDLRVPLQMLQATSPEVAAALSAYVATQPATAIGSTFDQTEATEMQPESVQSVIPNSVEASCGSEALQTNVSVSTSLLSEPVEIPHSTILARCASTASSDSLPSKVCALESSGIGVSSMSVLTDLPQFAWRHKSQKRQHTPSDVPRPSSAISNSSSLYSWDTASSSCDAISYSCHLCSFQSFHKTRFAEHVSSEFGVTNIAAMARQEFDGNSVRRKRCNHCTFSTYLAEEFDDHVRIHMSSALYYCRHCDYTGSSIGAIKHHYKRSHPNKSFDLQACMWQKSRVDHASRDRSQPHSVRLDPVVRLYDVKTLNHRHIRKLRKHYNLSRINLS